MSSDTEEPITQTNGSSPSPGSKEENNNISETSTVDSSDTNDTKAFADKTLEETAHDQEDQAATEQKDETVQKDIADQKEWMDQKDKDKDTQPEDLKTLNTPDLALSLPSSETSKETETSAPTTGSVAKSSKLSEALARARIIASKLTAEKAIEVASGKKIPSDRPVMDESSSQESVKDKDSDPSDAQGPSARVNPLTKKRPLDEVVESPGSGSGIPQEGKVKASRSNVSSRPSNSASSSDQSGSSQHSSYSHPGRSSLPTGPANHRPSSSPYHSQDAKRFHPSSVNSTHLPRHHSSRAVGGPSHPSSQQKPNPANMAQEFTVPSIHVGKIIGKHGEMLRLIEGRSGCHIQFAQAYRSNDTDRRVTVTGRPDQVDEARSAIQRLLDDLASGRPPNPYPSTPYPPAPGTHISPYTSVPQILPFANSNPVANSFLPTGNPAPASIHTPNPSPSPSSAVSQAPRSDAPPQPGEVRVQLAVPNHRVGLLIGKGGETIRELQIRSSARVHVQPDREMLPGQTERIVLVTGREDSTALAQQLIMEVVHQGKMGQASGGAGSTSAQPSHYPTGSYGSVPSGQYGGTYGTQAMAQYGAGAAAYAGTISSTTPSTSNDHGSTQIDKDQSSSALGRTISRVPAAGGPAGHMTETLEVTNDAAGMVIGKGGETVRQLQATSQARIQVEPIRQAINGMRKIHITGDEATVQYARQLVFAQVEARKRAGGGKSSATMTSAPMASATMTPAVYDPSMYGMYAGYSTSSAAMGQAGYPAYMTGTDTSYMNGATGAAATGGGDTAGAMDPAAIQQYYAAYYAAAAAAAAATGGNGQAPGTGGPSTDSSYYSMNPGQ
ncbi:hypothetical protein BJ684DRAFT_19092 [Piptocephalis cylindrospora]|uniref:K Homology domain-containing protein n=1 Tax=Piptocephalis cylindrospora TaxID=1907219 RepID=A0A4P9Y729_9FUNG|nr:hypothetical protein BJ684DRAFT_19092 [Piptocephalis cylindrospora]|eukprot:RKP14514.1 hypothetical protein BJ684DRAFT_19092 [Piptocephalis cylindrospora]